MSLPKTPRKVDVFWCKPNILLQTSAKLLVVLRCLGWHEVRTQYIQKIDPRTAKGFEFTSKSIPRRPKTQYLQVNWMQVVQNHSIYKQIHSQASQNTMFQVIWLQVAQKYSIYTQFES